MAPEIGHMGLDQKLVQKLFFYINTVHSLIINQSLSLGGEMVANRCAGRVEPLSVQMKLS